MSSSSLEKSNDPRKGRRCLAPLLAACVAACAAPASAPRTTVPKASPSRAPVAASVPDLGDRPALAELLRLALRRNPRIAAARTRADAAREGAAIEGSLPDPQLLIGWYEQSVQTRVGAQRLSAGVRQRIPFPGKLRLRAEIERARAGRAALVYESVVRDVLADVVRAAHELVYLDRAARISGHVGKLVERYAAAAAGTDEPGAPLNELFRAETQRAQLDNDRVVLAELRAVEAENIRTLLALPTEAPVGTPVVPPVPELALGYEDLVRAARAHSQELKAAGADVEIAALRAELARANRWPDLTLGYTHVFTDDLPDSIGSPPRSGEDARIVSFGVTLPVWGARNRAERRRARRLEDAAARAREDAELRLRAQLARAWFEVGNARRLVRLYEDVLVPRAEQAARSAEELRAAGKGTLAGALETTAVLHNFRLAAARARADHGRAVARLEALMGTPLELVKNEEEE